MLKTIIIDDEKRARDLLENSLKLYCPEVEILAKCEDVPDAVKAINRLQPDLIFLDIEMPNYSGFELFDFIDTIYFETIFVTAYSHYAIKAFEVSAMDYLLKPLQIDRLEAAIHKVIKQKDLKNSLDRLDILKENLSSKKISKLVIPYQGCHAYIDIQDIIALEAERSYCKFHIENKKSILASKSMKYYINLLIENHQFFRCHRSFFINTDKINRYARKNAIITMDNGLQVKVSREKKLEFDALFQRISNNK